MSPDGRTFKRLATVVTPRRGGPFALASPRWSPDGRWIVFSSRGSIVLIRSDGRKRRVLRWGGDGLSGYADPWFSLDGERVYYTYWQIGPVAGQLLSVRLDGSDARAETPRSYVYGNLYGEEPTPDLRWRVYERWQDHAVVVAPFGETHERVIAPPSLRHAGGFRWSLDTSEVVYRRRSIAADAPADLFTAGFEGTHETPLTNTPTRDERDPSWVVPTSVQFGRCPGYA